MTDADLARIFLVLAGFWPRTAPDIDDPVARAAHRGVFADLNPELIIEAIKSLAVEGREFCPPPGVIAAACSVKRPPYDRPFPPALPAPEITVDVPALLAEAREELRGRTSR